MKRELDAFARGRSILCVQPDEDARAWLEEILHGFECVSACNAYEALRNLHARPFDAYLLEYWLPDWSGPPLCREIRKFDPNSPIVFYSAAAGENSEGRALRAGADAYLRKPVEPSQVTDTLQQLFRRCETRSLQAKGEAERAVREALDRRAQKAAARTARDDRTHGLERIARAQAYKAFLQSGGTPANFERWWPQLFGAARDIHSLA